LIIGGVALIAVAPLEWILVEKKKTDKVE